MRPEERARRTIDQMLEDAGWRVQNRDELNLAASVNGGVALREASMAQGAADYLLISNRLAIGVVEAKKAGTTLSGIEEQSAKYTTGLPPGLAAARKPLAFRYEATDVEVHFTNDLDPEPRARRVFGFHRPETLREWSQQASQVAENETLRARLRQMPTLNTAGLRDCQIEAITNLERSFAGNRPYALIQMATGSGKTFTAVNSVYRLLRYGGAKRVLFLVDRANLGAQAFTEFQQFQVPGDGRKFTEIYGVRHLQSNAIDPATEGSNVYIATIQRLYSLLCNEPELPIDAEESSWEQRDREGRKQPKQVRYNARLPIETFDVIIVDECHRSIYNEWRNVLEYFDSFIVGLTATPNQQAFGFFQQNLVMQYSHARAVADGVNVDYLVYRIRTQITEQGSTIPNGFYVDYRDRLTRARRWQQLDEDVAYTAQQLDRDVVTPDQIRTVIRAFKAAIFTELFTQRTEVPKTLIFAKDDSHAEQIVEIVREEFERGNDFARKITYKASGKREEMINDFRTNPRLRVAVTVDMIATGTDVRSIEILLFMRSVLSRQLFDQMKGRGTRVIADTELRQVTPDDASKTHFVIVDAVGVCERTKTDMVTLERKKSVSLAALLEQMAYGGNTEDGQVDAAIFESLGSRLAQLMRHADADAQATITQAAGGLTLHDLSRTLIDAVDEDVILARAQQTSGSQEPDPAALSQAAHELADAAVTPFFNRALRDAITVAAQRDEQIIDSVSSDTVLGSGWDAQAEEAARATVTSFQQYIVEHRAEILALQVLLDRPANTRIDLKTIKALAKAIKAPPLGLTTDRLWRAYATLDQSRVYSAGARRLTTDLVALVRYALLRERDGDAVLEPFALQVRKRFDAWLDEQEQRRGEPFTLDQLAYLELMCDHITNSLSLEPDDFDRAPFVQQGGMGRVAQLFGTDLPTILEELNMRLVA